LCKKGNFEIAGCLYKITKYYKKEKLHDYEVIFAGYLKLYMKNNSEYCVYDWFNIYFY
jgi:hypothetical protein